MTRCCTSPTRTSTACAATPWTPSTSATSPLTNKNNDGFPKSSYDSRKPSLCKGHCYFLTKTLPLPMPCRPVPPKIGRWGVVIYSLLIRSFSLLFPFHKGKNKENISKNDMIKNDATSSPKGKQRNVGDKYATLSERWRKMAKCGEIPRRKKSKFRAKRQTSHWIVDMLIWCKLRVESWELRTIRVRQQLSIFNFQLSIFNLQLINGQQMTETRDETCQT